MKTQGPLLYDPTAASYNSEADDIVKGNPDAYVILDFPANYAKIGSALLRTGKFNGRKLFVAGGWPSTIPVFIPTASLEGARGTVAGSPTGTKACRRVRQAVREQAGHQAAPDARLEQLRRRDDLHPRVRRGELGEGLGHRQADPAGRVDPGQDVHVPEPRGARSGRSRPARTSTTRASAGPSTSTRTATCSAALYNVYTYKDGKQDVIRQLKIRK